MSVGAGELDNGSPIEEVRTGLDTIAAVYDAAGAGDLFSHYIEEGSGHVLSDAMWDKAGEHTGGTEAERLIWRKLVLDRHPHVWWLDGCAPPTVRDKLVDFRLKPDAKPVHRQPFHLSAYDAIRVRFHVEDNCRLGKMEKVDVEKEGYPEWATPVFMVDQDAKGLMGRMICGRVQETPFVGGRDLGVYPVRGG